MIQGFKIYVPEMRVYTTYRYTVVHRHSEIRGNRGCFVLLEQAIQFQETQRNPKKMSKSSKIVIAFDKAIYY